MLSNKQKFHITQASGGSGSAGVKPEMPVTAGALGTLGPAGTTAIFTATD